MPSLVSSLFLSRASAEYAVYELIKAGFKPNEVSLLMSEPTRLREFSGERRAPRSSKRAGFGLAEEAVEAGGLRVFQEIELAGPPVVGMGPIVVALSSQEVRTGSLSEALVGLGLSEHEADSLDRKIRQGRILVGVLLDEEHTAAPESPGRDWSREELEEANHLV